MPSFLRLSILARSCALLGAAWLMGAAPGPGPGDPFDAAKPGVLSVGDPMVVGATVHDVVLDPRGRLWVASQDGVFMLEGLEWKPLSLPPDLPSAHARCLCFGEDGSLWVGMESSGILRLREGRWTVWNKASGLSCNRVNHLVELPGASGRPEVWAATAGGGVLRRSGESWIRYGTDQGLADGWVWKLCPIQGLTGAREIWAATASGISILSGDRWKDLPRTPGHPASKVNGLLQVRGGAGGVEVWATCWGRGPVRWDGSRWEEFGPSRGFPGRNPTALALVPRPQASTLLVAATYDAGLAFFDGKVWKSILPDRTLAATGFYALCANRGGRPTLWAASRGLGLQSLNLGGWRLLDEQEGLPGSEIECFAESTAPGGGNTFWFGTSNGLLRWESDGRRIVENALSGFPVSRINALQVSESPGGEPVVWAGTIAGLVRRQRGVWRLLGPRDGLPVSQVFTLLECREPDGEKILWAGLEAGLARFRKGVWTLLTTRDGLPDNFATALEQTRGADGAAILWVATRGGGIARLDHGVWTIMNEGLPSLEIDTLKVSRSSDGRQWLWAGSGGGGLARLEVGRPKAPWETFGAGVLSELPSRFIYRLELDRQGSLYASTSKGIVRLKLEERQGVPTPVRLETFTRGDGIPNLSGLWFPSSHLDRLGRVWFGTPRGAVVLDPAEEWPVPPPLAPHLLSLTRDGSPLDYRTGMALRQTRQREVFEFALASFHRPEDIRYQTQVVGLEPAPGPWYPEGRRDLAGLPPGRYVLRVWARDYLGRVSPSLDLPFAIVPPWWLRTWAFGIYALMAAACLLLLHRLRVVLLQRRNRSLELLVRERTEALAATVQSLRSLNREHGEVIENLRGSLAEVKTLQGLIPICMKCKKIRDDEGFWNQLEAYISRHSEARFSHGYCPECSKEAFQEVADFKAQNRIAP